MVSAIAFLSQQFSMRDLAEEFVAAGIWPLARDWSFPTTPRVRDPELVCRDGRGTFDFQKDGFA